MSSLVDLKEPIVVGDLFAYHSLEYPKVIGIYEVLYILKEKAGPMYVMRLIQNNTDRRLRPKVFLDFSSPAYTAWSRIPRNDSIKEVGL